jgi:hypothetical protein
VYGGGALRDAGDVSACYRPAAFDNLLHCVPQLPVRHAEGKLSRDGRAAK